MTTLTGYDYAAYTPLSDEPAELQRMCKMYKEAQLRANRLATFLEDNALYYGRGFSYENVTVTFTDDPDTGKRAVAQVDHF
jgi:hypothetical protein